MFAPTQCRTLTGSAARHQKINPRLNLPPDKPSQRTFINRPIRRKRSNQSSPTSSKHNDLLPASPLHLLPVAHAPRRAASTPLSTSGLTQKTKPRQTQTRPSSPQPPAPPSKPPEQTPRDS